MTSKQFTLKEIGERDSGQSRLPPISKSHLPPTHCKIDGCNGDIRSLGLCYKHYMKQYREKQPPTNNKLCECGCGEFISSQSKRHKRGHDKVYVPEAMLLKHFKDGKSCPELAEIFGVGNTTIWNRLKRLGLKTEQLSGERSHRWKGGRRVTKYGYIHISKYGHPKCNSQGYVCEHILVMEEHIGRHIQKDEKVHHINFVKDDNRIENLWLCDSQSHNKSHPSLYPLVKQLLDDGIITFNRESGKYERVRTDSTATCPICNMEE